MKKLRKVLLILFSVLMALILLCVGYIFVCVNAQFFVDIRAAANPPRLYEQSITQSDDGIRIEFEDGRVMKSAVFNGARECVRAVGFTPITLDRRNLWGLWTYEDFIAEYGRPHGEVPTSDIPCPLWITDDGYMILMWAAGEKWLPLCIGNYGEVWVYDLLATPE